MGITEDFSKKLDKVVAENLDMHRYMAQDLEITEKKFKTEYDKLLESTTERILEDKESEIRLLRFRMSKYKTEAKEDLEDQNIKREFEFQQHMYP